MSDNNVSCLTSYIITFNCSCIWCKSLPKGKVQKKNSKKKLTNVSFAFTHTYTLVKTNIFGIFSQACLENFEKCVKTPKKPGTLSHVYHSPGNLQCSCEYNCHEIHLEGKAFIKASESCGGFFLHQLHSFSPNWRRHFRMMTLWK